MKSRSKSFDLQNTSPPLKSSEKPKDSKFTLFKGLLLGLFSGIFYSLVSVLVKDIKNVHPGQLSLYRFIAFLVCSMPQTVQRGENVLGPKKLRLILLIRGLFAGGHIFFNFISFRYLPLGEATAIAFSMPVFVTVAARVFLKEPCSTFQSVTVVLTVVGIAFTAKLPSRLMGDPVIYSKDTIYGILAAILALCFNTAQYICVRKVKSVHHAVLMFNFGLIAVVEVGLLTYLFGDFKWHYCGIQKWYIILLGILSYIGQTMVVIALQLEFAGPVSTMKAASDIILAFIWQTFLFNDPPDLFSIMGALLVGSSVAFVGITKWLMSFPEESSQRKKLKWLVS
ncbi:solute carrier family 35 member G1 [Trichonephila inaurata madagascariensis]|uniref:Solute carrier family 35 member G1 n=1 Tax=Trichonephila inaurata madagascariensis TaxID=2747483 RepID=A0A8X7C736_9ARAC|nr:solute carrier family 35 member G1 [Trichonephila inaurata madagascariensis]